MKRSYAHELMDNFSITDARVDEALQELNVINRFLGGSSVSKNGFSYFKNLSSSKNLKILDFGSGGTNLFLDDFFENDFVVNADRNIRTCKFLKVKNLSDNIVCADVNNPPFKNNSFDVVHTSLFLHHFEEREIENYLMNFLFIAGNGIAVNDLRRSVFALAGIKILTLLFSKSEFVKYDAPLSVKKGFTKKELQKIFSKLNFERIKIKRKWAFRWMIVFVKNSR